MRLLKAAFFLITLCTLILFLMHCGYLDSAFNPVQSSPTTLSGRVVDSITKTGIPGALVKLAGSKDITVVSGENGLFQFNESTTGSKDLTVNLGGYVPYVREVDMTRSPNTVDTLFLRRENHPPVIDKLIYPSVGSPKDLPLSIQFSWAFSDQDYITSYSRESLRYYFYFGTANPPALADSGELDITGMRRDSSFLAHYPFVAYMPDSLFSGLAPNTVYHWRVVIRDLFGDSCASPNCSFTTRTLRQPCPIDSLDTMLLVEMEDQTFCMDKYEVTNLEYARVYYPLDELQFLKPESLSQFSTATNTPVINISQESADTLCARRGKRLCTISEWKAALGGYKRWNYPYGDVYDSAKCNTHWILNEFIGRAMPVDSPAGCVSTYGIYDLSGNVAEWVTLDNDARKYFDEFDNEGNLLNYYSGGFWSSFANSGLGSVYYMPNGRRSSNIGFRCCQGY